GRGEAAGTAEVARRGPGAAGLETARRDRGRSADARGNRQGRGRVGPAVHATRGGDRAASNRTRERYVPDRGRVDGGGQPAPGARAAPRRAGGPGGRVGSARGLAWRGGRLRQRAPRPPAPGSRGPRLSAVRRPLRDRSTGGDGTPAPGGLTGRGPPAASCRGVRIPPSRCTRGVRGGAAGGERSAHGPPQPARARARADP